MQHVRSLITQKHIAIGSVCALLDAPRGLDQVAQVSKDVGHDVSWVCSAVEYDNLFAEVRGLLQRGESTDGIQRNLDSRWSHLRCATTTTGQDTHNAREMLP
mmetsp:Transcript_35046/g.75821  ORF Transcript_35046/g.75821 Transcript_35046/m.75821 type:complete len:102 (+) Transcript_35046:56-361(+)